MPAQKRLRIDHNPLSGLTLLRRLALPRLALLRLALALGDPPLASAKAALRPSGVRDSSGSSSPRASP